VPVFLWKPVTKSAGTDPDTGEEATESYLVARYYRVFNVEQVDGLDLEPVERERHDWHPLDQCERIVADMPERPGIRHAGTHAYYSPASDVVTMPERDRFAEPEDYYGVLFHELAHATGHESRLARGLEAPAPFGSPDYSREELVAELAAAFVCGAAGIDTPRTERNHAAYLANWLRVLRADARMVVTAAARASKAADWILGDPRGGATS
jgi:antirestriction protein ArdC